MDKLPIHRRNGLKFDIFFTDVIEKLYGSVQNYISNIKTI